MMYSQLLKYHLVVVILAFITRSNCAFFKKSAKPSVEIVRGVNCLTKKEQETGYKFEVFIHKFNRTAVAVNMNLTMPEAFGTNARLEFEIKLWGDGGWKNNFFTYKDGNPCHSLYTVLGAKWREIVVLAGCKPKCPSEPGYYHFKNYALDLGSVPIIIQSGRFLVIANVFRKVDNTKLFCLHAEVEVKPVLR